MVDGHFVCLGEDGIAAAAEGEPEEVRGGLARRADRRRRREQPLLEYPCWAAPILSHGLLYLRGDDRLVCLELIARQ